MSRDLLCATVQTYFGGGTVTGISADSSFAAFRKGSPALEDGTLDYLSIAALNSGFDWLSSLGGMSAIRARCHDITRYAYEALSKT